MISTYIAFAFAACLLFYCGLVLFAVYYLWVKGERLKEKDNRSLVKDKGHFFSVIIPARNEAANIEACLHAVLAQDYPHFEVILINDHSTDDTAARAHAIAEQQPKLTVIDLKTDARNAYKKAAIAQAIALAKGDIIVQTDADCVMGPEWLTALSAPFSNGIDLVSAPVQLISKNLALSEVERSDFITQSVFHKLQALEHQGLVMLGGGSLLGGFPNMANGANLAYRKEVFQAVGGFAGVDHVASGDDELLLQKVHQAGYRLDFLLDRKAIVQTSPMDSFGAFRAQRLRWVSKAKAYKNRKVNVVQIISYMAFVAFPFWLITGEWEFFVAGFIGKFIVDGILMLQASRFFRTFRLLWLLPVLEPLYIIYVLWVGIAGNFITTYTWKDRTVS